MARAQSEKPSKLLASVDYLRAGRGRRRSFQTAFRRHYPIFGKLPHQYPIAMRLNFAEALLRKGELAIVEMPISAASRARAT